jgi:hypothetical protein
VPGFDPSVPTTCTFEATCSDLKCGETWSDFDAQGCRKPMCQSSDDCASGQRCVPRTLRELGACAPSVYEYCEPNGCACSCYASADCARIAYCQPESEFPPSEDCPLPDNCADIPLYLGDISDESSSYTGDTADAMQACEAKLTAAYEPCNDIAGQGGGAAQGGAGAGGQSAGGAGGQH